MTSILTNTGAMVALATLREVNSNLTDVQGMISTGKKVADSVDNAAIWAVTAVMQADVDGFGAISESLSLGKASISVARNASEQITELLREVKEKVVAAQDENIDRTKIQTDINELRNQINTIVSAAQFNGLNLIDGNTTDVVNVLSSLDRSSTGVATSNIEVSRQDLSTNSTTVGTATGNTVAIDNAAAPAAANESFDYAIVSPAANEAASVEVIIDSVSYGTLTLDTTGSVVDTDIAGQIADYIDNLGIAGIDASVVDDGTGTASELRVTNTGAFDDRVVEFTLTGTGTFRLDSTVPTATGATTTAQTLTPEISSQTLANTGNTYTVTIEDGAANTDSTDFVLAIGNQTIDFTVAGNQSAFADSSEEFEAAYVAAQINALGIEGITAAYDPATADSFTITNANPFSDFDLTVTVANGAGNQSVTIYDASTSANAVLTAGATNGIVNGDNNNDAFIEGASKELTFTAAALTAGDSYSVQLRKDLDGDGTVATDEVVQFDYVAKAGDTLNEVALGLQSEVAADTRFSEVLIEVATALDPTIDDVVMKLATSSGTVDAAVFSNSGGVAGGGLADLADFDVTTSAGAAQALVDIETLIQTAVDASAAFGSSEKRIDIQSEFVISLMDSLTSGIGALVDADMEAASARLQALQVQQQLGTQALAIANSSPQSILTLFQ